MAQQILIVEDNELNRELLCELLADEYETLIAENGLAALEILEKNRDQISLVLLDVMMPVMDGYTFLDIMRKDTEMSSIPVIIMTRGDSEADEIAALEHGANDFVPKPYRPQIIKHRIANLIKFRENVAMVDQFKYDPLTGLYTKEYFYRKVREVLEQNPKEEYTIISCNIENFKLYNDTFGRKAGDQLLIRESEIFTQNVGSRAICCHYNADRFLAILPMEDEREGRVLFLKERKKRRSELPQNVVVNVGIYEIKNRSMSVEQMCDRALWVADTIKGKFNQFVAVYDDTIRNKLIREKRMTDAMETALKEKQFTVYFQPKYDLRDECIVGAEALVRWIHPQWGFVSPGEFIPLFERNGSIRLLDEYVWENVCQQLKEWNEKGIPAVPVSVNVSRADMYQPNLVEHLSNLIEKYEIDPSFLHLEITESAYTDQIEQIIKTTERLREIGFVIKWMILEADILH